MRDIFCRKYSMIDDLERRQALMDLMMLPDEPEMKSRTHKVTQPGKAERFDQIPGLVVKFVQTRLLERDEREKLREQYHVENQIRNDQYSNYTGDGTH